MYANAAGRRAVDNRLSSPNTPTKSTGISPAVLKVLEEAESKEDPKTGKQNNKGRLNFVLAAELGELERVQRYVAAGAEVDMLDHFQHSMTALYWAARNGHFEVLSVLLAAGADVCRTDRNGNTPLIIAAHYGRSRVVQLLIEARSDLNKSNHGGQTALILAAYYERVDVVRTLLLAGANAQLKETEGRTARNLAGHAKHYFPTCLCWQSECAELLDRASPFAPVYGPQQKPLHWGHSEAGWPKPLAPQYGPQQKPLHWGHSEAGRPKPLPPDADSGAAWPKPLSPRLSAQSDATDWPKRVRVTRSSGEM